MKFIACTLTGVDEHTSISHLNDLSLEYPFAEWGVLISQTQKDNRYPSAEWVDDFQSEILHSRYAFHLCGGAVYEFLAGSCEIRQFAYLAHRIQLNFNHNRKPIDVQSLTDEVIPGSAPAIIIQEHAGNAGLNARRLGCRHQVLFDASGGRGILASKWQAPLPGFIQGYAGGLSPDNVAEEFSKIADVAGDTPFWIDMESSLRDESDRFDLDRCERVLSQVKGMLAEM